MKKTLISAFFFTLLSLYRSVYAADPQHSFNIRTATDINTSFESRFFNEGKYQLTLEEKWQLSAGYMIMPGQHLVTGYHIEAGYDQLFFPQISLHMKLLNRAYHNFNLGENSILTWLSWRDNIFEADFGLNVRFTNFGSQNINLIFAYTNDLVQPFFLIRAAAYYQFENPDIRLGFEIKNFDWSYASNTYSVSFHIDTIYQVTKELSLRLNAGMIPSGISGLQLTLNRFTIFLGAQYKI